MCDIIAVYILSVNDKAYAGLFGEAIRVVSADACIILAAIFGGWSMVDEASLNQLGEAWRGD